MLYDIVSFFCFLLYNGYFYYFYLSVCKENKNLNHKKETGGCTVLDLLIKLPSCPGQFVKNQSMLGDICVQVNNDTCVALTCLM